MRRHKRSRYFWKNRRNLITLRVISVFAVLVFLAAVVDMKVRPIVRSMAENQANYLINTVIDDAVTRVLSQDGADYDNLVRIVLGDEGEIKSIQSRTVEINRLKAAISTAIGDGVAASEKKRIRIPVGTIIGGDLLTGRGPRLELYITLSSSTQVQITNNFESTGINQTKHQILLDVYVKVYIILTGNTTSTVVNTNFVVAETVIVGNVPEVYLNADGIVGDSDNEDGELFADGDVNNEEETLKQ